MLVHADAFEDAAQQEETTTGVDYVHIRVQQRNGKKSLTTVQVRPVLGWAPRVACSLLSTLYCHLQGLKKSYDYKKVLKALKKGMHERAQRPACLVRRLC